MKVLSTKVDSEVAQKFLDKIKAEGLEASDVLRRLVNAYVGEPTNPLKPLASAVEVDVRLDDIDDRLREFGTEVDDRIKERNEALKTELIEGLKTELGKFPSGNCDLLKELVNSYNRKMSDIDSKFLALAKTLGPMMDVMKKTVGANICADDVKALALLSNESVERWCRKDQFNDLVSLLGKR